MGNLCEFQMPGRPDGPNAAPLDRLTPRQLEVLGMLCEGLSNKLIARRLDIASGTVKVHIVRILRALEAGSRLQAVLIARDLGFVPKQQHSPDIRSAEPPATSLSLAEIMMSHPERTVRAKVVPQCEAMLLGVLMSKRLDATA